MALFDLPPWRCLTCPLGCLDTHLSPGVEEYDMDAAELIELYNYGWEQHVCQTQDGFSLVLYRVVKPGVSTFSSSGRAAIVTRGYCRPPIECGAW